MLLGTFPAKYQHCSLSKLGFELVFLSRVLLYRNDPFLLDSQYMARMEMIGVESFNFFTPNWRYE